MNELENEIIKFSLSLTNIYFFEKKKFLLKKSVWRYMFKATDQFTQTHFKNILQFQSQ